MTTDHTTEHPRTANLPKWAQAHLRNQARQIDDLTDQLDELRNEQTVTNGWQSTGGWPRKHNYLTANHDGRVRVEFGNPDGSEGLYAFEIIYDHEAHEIELRSSGFGGHLALLPRASNVVLVKAVER